MLRELQACPAVRRRARFKVPSRSHPGTDHTVEVSMTAGQVKCDCPGFNFRGTCIHTEFEEDHCGWAEGVGEPQTPEQRANGICPRCGSTTIRVAAPEPEEEDSEAALRAKGVRVPPPAREGR